MATTAPPKIFSPERRLAVRRRAKFLQTQPDAPHFLIDDMMEDVIDRLGFLRLSPQRALVIGAGTELLIQHLQAQGGDVTAVDPDGGFDEEMPFPFGGFDFIASLGTLDTVNDLPGALVHIRRALAPSGMMMASFLSAGSLPVLRDAMMAADGDRAAPRLHPTVDVRSGGQLLQRTGFANPVIDQRPVRVGYRSLSRLASDLRALGATNVLADPGPPLGKTALAKAGEMFAAAGTEGRTVETFEILTLSGWKPNTGPV